MIHFKWARGAERLGAGCRALEISKGEDLRREGFACEGFACRIGLSASFADKG